MFTTFARLLTGQGTRWVVGVLWISLAAVLVPVGAGIEGETQNDTQSLLPADAQSSDVSRLLNARFESGETAVALLVYRARGDEPFTVAQRRAIAADAERAKEIPLVVEKRRG